MDTLAYVVRLQAARVPQDQAEARIEILKAATAENLVTKGDLEATKSELEIALASLETRLVKWFIVALLAQGGFVVVSIKLLPA